MARRRTRARQQSSDFRTWGGPRKGAGPKRRSEIKLVSHRTRSEIDPRQPLHVVVRVKSGLPSLRCDALRRAIERALAAGCERFDFRLVHFSIQSNHLHFVAEAGGKDSLARGMKGLLVRIARTLNRVLHRTGSIFADRYFARSLATPREVRNVLVYVLRNAAHHSRHFAGIDRCSSGAWFDGWLRPFATAAPPLLATHARTWLLSIGWKKHGLIRFEEGPADVDAPVRRAKVTGNPRLETAQS